MLMAMGIYKQGQGYWTRLMSAIGLGVLVLMGGNWVADLVRNASLFGLEPLYTRAAAFVIVVAVCATIGYYLLGRHQRVVDFMIATEGEMKKVNWSSKKEIIGSTYVVIGMTVFIAIFCFVFDRAYAWLSDAAGVLNLS